MLLVRNNAFVDIQGAQPWFLDILRRRLAITLATIERDAKTRKPKAGERFGHVFFDENAGWRGSLILPGPRAHAGLTTHIIKLAQEYGVRGSLKDVRVRPPDELPMWCVKAPWRPYQDAVFNAVIARHYGVVNAPPRSGKTLMAARIIDALNHPTIYLAPSVQIVRQTYNVFVSQFGEDLVARFDGEATRLQKDPEKQIIVSTAASCAKMPDEWLATRRVLIIDEFHHAAAETYHTISARMPNAYYRIGLTGTHFRSGDDELAMEAVCSTLIARIQLADLMPHFLTPPRVVFAKARQGYVNTGDYAKDYEAGIVRAEQRNVTIAKIARVLSYENGIPTVVLTKAREHADTLGEMISGSITVKGGGGAHEGIAAFNDGKYDVLVGTSVIGEGVDLPRAAALVFAGGGAATVQMMQSYYRPLTAQPGKTVGLIYDFQDDHNRTLNRHSAERIAFAREHLGDCVVVL